MIIGLTLQIYSWRKRFISLFASVDIYNIKFKVYIVNILQKPSGMLAESNQKESEKQLLTNEINKYQKVCDRLNKTCQVLEMDFVRLIKR